MDPSNPKLKTGRSELASSLRAKHCVQQAFSLLGLLVLLTTAWRTLRASPPARTTGGTIVGTVCDERGGRVPGVEVFATDEKSKETISTLGTNRGTFVFGGLAAGTYRVEVLYPGLSRWAQPGVRVTDGGVVRLSPQLSGYQRCVQGWQVHPVPWWARSSGPLLVGVVIRSGWFTSPVILHLINQKSKAVFTSEVNQAGEFAIGNVPAGLYTLQMVPIGRPVIERRNIRLSHDGITTLVASTGHHGDATPAIRIHSRLRFPPEQVSGQAADPSGAVVPDAEIHVTKENSTLAMIGLGTCDGRFAVYGLAPGTYKVAVRFSGFRTWARAGLKLGSNLINLDALLEIGFGGPVVVSPSVAPAPVAARGQIRGKIVDRAGIEVTGATILLTNSETGERMTAQTNMDGRFALNRTTPAIYHIKISFPGLKNCTLNRIVVSSGKASVVEAVMGEEIPGVCDVRVGKIKW